MTLASRCPACGTVFRVVPDQLRVSQGWVRCGRCNEAFNAIEAMVPTPPPAEPAEQQADPTATHARVEEWPAEQAGAAYVAGPAPDGAEVVVLRASHGSVSSPVQPTRADSAAVPHATPVAPPDMAPPHGPPQSPGARAASAAPEPTLPTTPSFVRAADRAERWRRPWVRRTLATGVLLASAALAAQAALAFRDRLAASSPALKPMLQRACTWAGCRVDDYRLIEALSVETTGLVRVEGSSVYRFSITLRNRAPHEVAAPAIDLSLTDGQGRAIARRVLRMADLNLPLRTLKAGTELPIQVPLGIPGQVAGYTVEIFYP